ncbi:MAG: D-tyrosyl-tRNA(Tyr) deacylase [Bacteroidetes bacterium]|nr:D-tyrosyl-tRNA(Tyr) deacylase [Bacteroidota bacterium]MBU2583826.1 D-tyrosyl-tRNA(Tyr) deacylase [Bacteroidota bacterium]
MKAVVQRVSRGSVEIGTDYERKIGEGMVVLLGVNKSDLSSHAKKLAEKICNLRIFNDENEKLNKSIIDIHGEMLIISQFTIYGDCRKGNRPSFTDAAGAELGNKLYQEFVENVSAILGADKVKTGIFGAMMSVEIINDGPVTLIVSIENEELL